MRIECIVDRIEEDHAVIELPDLTTISFPLRFLPDAIVEGATLLLEIELPDQKST
jgi:hypothetical protein